MRASPGLLLFVVMLAVVVPAGHAGGQGPVEIWIKPTTTWSVTGDDDIAHLKHLAAGVGGEFAPNMEILERLQGIGIRYIRAINVDPIKGTFDESGRYNIGDTTHLARHVHICRTIGASPHLIIAQKIPKVLHLGAEDVPPEKRWLMGNPASRHYYGPRDYGLFQNYCDAFFEHVMIEEGFTNACFEVGNEPDTGGCIYPEPPIPAQGSRRKYEAYFLLYRNVAEAAARFEAAHPGITLKLGGPALAWAYTFRFGDFNWADQFVKDCAEQNVKLDFIGIHYYGNVGSLHGEYGALYPSFVDMLKQTQAARDQYRPGLPIWFTEWGASYHTSNDPRSIANANHIGAAWSAAFLNTMLHTGVDRALFLVATDLQQPDASGKLQNMWGWPSLFVNPNSFKTVTPTPTFHLFDMIHRLEGTRVESTRGIEHVNGIASANADTRTVTVLLWNYGAQLPEGGPAVEQARHTAVNVRIREAEAFFGEGNVRMERWMVSENLSNAHTLFLRGEALDDRAGLQRVAEGTSRVVDRLLDVGFGLPPSGVSLLKLSAAP